MNNNKVLCYKGYHATDLKYHKNKDLYSMIIYNNNNNEKIIYITNNIKNIKRKFRKTVREDIRDIKKRRIVK